MRCGVGEVHPVPPYGIHCTSCSTSCTSCSTCCLFCSTYCTSCSTYSISCTTYCISCSTNSSHTNTELVPNNQKSVVFSMVGLADLDGHFQPEQFSDSGMQCRAPAIAGNVNPQKCLQQAAGGAALWEHSAELSVVWPRVWSQQEIPCHQQCDSREIPERENRRVRLVKCSN